MFLVVPFDFNVGYCVLHSMVNILPFYYSITGIDLSLMYLYYFKFVFENFQNPPDKEVNLTIKNSLKERKNIKKT